MNSDEFRAWHEVGHATVCLHFGGDVEAIEFLADDAQGFAVARGCEVIPDKERHVACAGFAAEYYLLQSGNVIGLNLNDASVVAKVSALLFSNAWSDRQAFARRTVTEDNDLSPAEDEEFMWFAINQVAPIIQKHFVRMTTVVEVLLATRRVEGWRVREMLGFAISL